MPKEVYLKLDALHLGLGDSDFFDGHAVTVGAVEPLVDYGVGAPADGLEELIVPYLF